MTINEAMAKVKRAAQAVVSNWESPQTETGGDLAESIFQLDKALQELKDLEL